MTSNMSEKLKFHALHTGRRTSGRVPATSVSVLAKFRTIYWYWQNKGGGEGKSHAITCHEDTQRRQRYSSHHTQPRHYKWVDGQRHAPTALPPGEILYPPYKRLSGPWGRSGRVLKFCPQRNSIPGRPSK